MERRSAELQGPQTVCTQLEFQIKEFDLLSSDYDLSFGDATYNIVWDLMGRIRLLEKRLETKPNEGRKPWKENVAKELKAVTTTIQKEIAEVLDLL